MMVSVRLETRLNKVPGVTSADIDEWVTEAMEESGLTEAENENALLYLALSLAYEIIATNAAHFFKYSDGEESVDKSNVYANYMQLAKEARKNYRKQTRGGFGASQTHVGRADER